jgi:hypothetical protein
MYIFSERSKLKNEKHLVKGVERWDEVTRPGIYEHPYNCIGWIIFRSSNS